AVVGLGGRGGAGRHPAAGAPSARVPCRAGAAAYRRIRWGRLRGRRRGGPGAGRPTAKGETPPSRRGAAGVEGSPAVLEALGAAVSACTSPAPATGPPAAAEAPTAGRRPGAGGAARRTARPGTPCRPRPEHTMNNPSVTTAEQDRSHH